MHSQPFTQIVDKDITKETAPSLDIMRDLIQEVIFPTWNYISYYMTSNYPKFSKLFSFVFRNKIAQAHRKYFSGGTSGKQFALFKTYRLFLYQKNNWIVNISKFSWNIYLAETFFRGHFLNPKLKCIRIIYITSSHKFYLKWYD